MSGTLPNGLCPPPGDHEVAICRVVDYQTVSAEARPLYTGYLREQGLY